MNKLNIVVLISGNGSNLQAIIDAKNSGLNVNIKAVISNNPDAYGLERATRSGITTKIINHDDFSDRNDFDQTLCDYIKALNPDLIVLAGFMRILGANFINAFNHKIINIHPSLLPKHPGINTHEKVLGANDQFHGVSIHFVTHELDAEPIIAQGSFPVEDDETLESLTEKCHQLEHQMYPEVLKWFADERIALYRNRVLIDNEPLPLCGYPFTQVGEPYHG